MLSDLVHEMLYNELWRNQADNKTEIDHKKQKKSLRSICKKENRGHE